MPWPLTLKGPSCSAVLGEGESEARKPGWRNNGIAELSFSRKALSMLRARRSAMKLFTAGTMLALSGRRAQAGRSEGEFLSTAQIPEPNQNGYASDDTFVSVGKVYEMIQSSLAPTSKSGAMRALDLGSGAGMSTQTLWNLGYRDIVAVDQSRQAWDTFVVSQPSSVKFLHLTDEEFVESFTSDTRNHENVNDIKFDAVVINFAVNPSKAQKLAKALLRPQGHLLAPVNDTPDYWFEQSYLLYDSSGKAERRSRKDYLFQPDVTEGSCQGIWCARKLIDRDY
mmetsp:Transcript_6336/g.15305  ORF Transcript_6336/g.15305 Transcript_6336/m.15305 type:complete len:282 (-) Transcript_6336:158-1003(-)